MQFNNIKQDVHSVEKIKVCKFFLMIVESSL